MYTIVSTDRKRWIDKAYLGYRKASEKSCLQFTLEPRMVQKIRGKEEGHFKMGKNLAEEKVYN